MLFLLVIIFVHVIVNIEIICSIKTNDENLISTTIKQCKHGNFVIYKYDNVISHHLDLYGEWAEKELGLFLMIIKPGDVVIDAGANIGAFTIPLAKAVGEYGKVYGFEPQRIINQILNGNVVINNLENVYIYHAALGNTTGTIDVPEVDYHKEQNYGYFSLVGNFSGVKTYSVPLLTLDSIFLHGHHQLECPSFIKLDVEQMEVSILLGSKELLHLCRPIVFSENNSRKSSHALIDTFYELEYIPFWYFTTSYNVDNYNQVKEDISNGWIDVNIICIPIERLDNSSHPNAVYMQNNLIKIHRSRPFVYQYPSNESMNPHGVPYFHFQGND